MALDINNATFRAFTDFAKSMEAVKGGNNSIARVTEGINISEGALAGRTITAATADSVKGFFHWRRADADKLANNETRAIFKQAIIDMFGGESNIPKSVKDAMKLGDYGKGKPLTARRIMAVKTEVSKAFVELDKAFAAAKTSAASVYESKAPGNDAVAVANLDHLVETAIKTALKDPDALGVVIKHMRHILLRGDASLRSAEAVQKKVADLLANMAEIRRAAGGDKAVVKAGIACLDQLCGKSVRAGVLGGIVRAVKGANIGHIKHLAASSHGIAIHKAVEQFTRLQVELAVSSGAEASLEGADEKVSARNFIASLLIAKCGNSTVAKIQRALNGDEAKKLMFVYDVIENLRFDKASYSKGLLQHISTMGARAKSMLTQFKMAVDTQMGVPDNEMMPVDAFEGQFDVADFGGGEILEDLEESAKQQSKAYYDEAMGIFVGGNGPAADIMRNVVTNRIGAEPGESPVKDFAFSANRNITGMVNWNVCRDAKVFALGNGKTSIFARDIVRNLKVNLPGGKRLANDFDTALDELAAFATKGAKTSYAALDAKEKNKVHIVIAFLSQESGKAAFDGQATAFDPKNNSPAYVTASDQDRDIQEYSIGFNEKGAFTFGFLGRMNLQVVTAIDGSGKGVTGMANEGSTLETEFFFEISANEMERMASLDFTQFDDSATMTHMTDMQTRNKLANLPQTFAEEFRFDEDAVSCSSRIHAEFK